MTNTPEPSDNRDEEATPRQMEPIVKSKRRLPAGAILVLTAIILSLTVVGLDSYTRYSSILITSNHNLGTPPPAVDFSSPSGYEMGMRRLVLPQSGIDGLHWIMHTQKLLHDGGWRIRFTDNDNYPEGREIHWSHSFIWWLILVGKVHSLLTGLPLPASVEAVAPWANTLFLGALILILPLIVFRRLGALPASAIALGIPASCFFFEFFFVGYPDHHGLAAGSAMLTLLCLGLGGAGWVLSAGSSSQEPGDDRLIVTRAAAGLWFCASAFWGAFCLWISAATAAPVMLGIAGGAILSAWCFARPADASGREYDPGLWRLWGIAGCIFSLFFYLLEYFPSHMGMRLEVNHPLFSIAWLGGGEVLARLAAWRVSGIAPWKGNGRWILPLSVLAVGILPGIIFLFRDQVFLVSDKFVWALHRDYIGEFQSLPEKIDYDYISMFLPILLGFPLLGVATLRLLLIKNIPPTWKSALLLCVIPGVCLSALAFLQVRWMGVAHALWLALLPLWVACLASRFCHKAIRRPEILLYILVFGATIFQFPRVIVESFVACYGKNELPSPAEAFGMVIREMCHKMRRNHEGNEPICILGGPTTTTWMMYYGGFKGLGTLYWENKNGLMAAASIYNARTEEEALNLVKEHHITHLAVFSLDPFVFQYPRLLRGLPFGSKPHDAFLPRILDEFIVPKWMNPIYYPLPDLFNGQWVCLYEMKPGQKEADWFSSFARFYGDRGDHEKALAKYADSLKAEPHQPDLEVEYARMLFLSGKRADGEKWLSEGLAGRPPAQAAQTCYMIGKDCMDASRNKEALALARQALRANPQLPEAKHLAAWLMATSSDLDVHCPKEALALASDNADLRDRVAYLDALAAAHAANLHFIVAVRFGQEAVDQAIASHASKQVVEALQARLKMYGESKKFIAR